MKKILLWAIWSFCGSLFAQPLPDWNSIVPAAFASLDGEAADSVAARRAESTAVRSKMETIIQAAHLNRETIFGPLDMYSREGMSSNFNREPTNMWVKIERDSNIVSLENEHVKLYHSDKAVLRWLDIAQRIKNHPDRRDLARWPLRYRQIPPQMRGGIESPQGAQRWVTQEAVCDLAAAIESTSPDKASGKIRSFNLDFKDVALDTMRQLGADWPLPYPPESIWYSFPLNGQYSFRRDESNPGVGYIVFPKGVSNTLYPLNNSDFSWKARWCSAEGRVTYTQAELRMGHQFFFNLPDRYLEPGHLYRLEIIYLPKVSIAPMLPDEVCWQLFRGRTTDKMPTQVRLPGERPITQLFFRAGMYGLSEKLNQMKGDIDWQQGLITFDTDEPLDQMETKGGGRFAPLIRLNMLTYSFDKVWNALDSKELCYYLSVPEVEPLEKIPVDQLVSAELDNTLDAPFMRRTTLGAPDNYPGIPEHRLKSVNIMNGYKVPALAGAMVPDSFATSRPVPFITRQHFEKGKAPELGMTRCTLFVGEFRQLLAAYPIQLAQIKKRMEERARFLFQLETRRAQRLGTTPPHTMEELLDLEKTNLPAAAKTLLDAKLPDVFKPNFTLTYSRYFPGSTQASTEATIPFDKKK